MIFCNLHLFSDLLFKEFQLSACRLEATVTIKAKMFGPNRYRALLYFKGTTNNAFISCSDVICTTLASSHKTNAPRWPPVTNLAVSCNWSILVTPAEHFFFKNSDVL